MTTGSSKCNVLCAMHAKGNSTPSHHYWRQKDQSCLNGAQLENSMKAQLPNASCITSTSQRQLPLHDELSQTSNKLIILPTLQSSSLMFLGQLCDDNCDFFLNKKSLIVCKNDKTIFKMVRNSSDRLWDIAIKSHTQSNYFQIPSASPSLCQSTNPITSMSVLIDINNTNSSKKISRRSSASFHSIPKHMKSLEPLACCNIFKETIKNHANNFIIRKDKHSQIYLNACVHHASHQKSQHSQLILKRTNLSPSHD